MLTILVLVVGVVMVLVLVLLAVVVAGIKQEPPAEELTSQPPNAITAWVRRVLGVYVRKPDQPQPVTKTAENRVLPPGIRSAGQKGLRNEGPPTVIPRSSGHHDPNAVSPGYECRAPGLMRPGARGGESHCGHTRSSK